MTLTSNGNLDLNLKESTNPDFSSRLTPYEFYPDTSTPYSVFVERLQIEDGVFILYSDMRFTGTSTGSE